MAFLTPEEFNSSLISSAIDHSSSFKFKYYHSRRNTVNEDSLKVILGLDFHSTWHDVYYTTDRQLNTVNNSFTDKWLAYIENNLENYKVNDQPSGLMSPVSKGWFITQFNAPGITFEIGDNTPIEFIREKGKVAAEGMMKVLLEN